MMNPFFLSTRFRRVGATLLPLVVGILMGVAWTSGNPPLVTAQPPETTAPFTPLGDQAPFLGGGNGERVTVVEARPGRDVAGSGGLIGFSHLDDSGTQVITIVDAEKRWMAVYHVGSQGTIRLVSSREIAADFTLELNATPPLPDQIRRLQGLPSRSK